MKRLLIVLAFIMFITFVPATKQYIAEAGRTTSGDVLSPYCQCGCPAPPVCYDESTWAICSSAPGTEPPPECGGSLTANNGNENYSTLGMLALASLFLWWRLR